MEKITSLSTIHGMMPFEKARKAAASMGARLIPNRMAGKLMSEPISCGQDGIYTGTVVAFPAQGKPFGHMLEFPCLPLTYLLDTGRFSGERDIALVFEDFDIVEDDRTRRYVLRSPPGVLHFPQESGWYGTEAIYAAPDSRAIADQDRRVYLYRPQEAGIMPIVRKFGQDGRVSKDMVLTSRLTQPRDVLVESPVEAEQGKRVADIIPIRK